MKQCKYHFQEILHINEYVASIKLFVIFFYFDRYAITHSKSCGHLLIDKLLLNNNLRTLTFYIHS